jgi:hypothetical protein
VPLFCALQQSTCAVFLFCHQVPPKTAVSTARASKMARKGPAAPSMYRIRQNSSNEIAGEQSPTAADVNNSSPRPVSQVSGQEKTFSFTQSQLSLALSIQKSRPLDVNTRGMSQGFTCILSSPSKTIVYYCRSI